MSAHKSTLTPDSRSVFWFQTELFCCLIVSAWACTVPPLRLQWVSHPKVPLFYIVWTQTIIMCCMCLCVCVFSFLRAFFLSLPRRKVLRLKIQLVVNIYMVDFKINKTQTFACLTKRWQVNERENILLYIYSYTKGVQVWLGCLEHHAPLLDLDWIHPDASMLCLMHFGIFSAFTPSQLIKNSYNSYYNLKLL